MREELSCWLEAYWKVPMPNPSLPAPLPSRGKKWANQIESRFSPWSWSTDLWRKNTHVLTANISSLSRESKEEKKIHFERKGYVSQCILGKMFCDIYTKREFQSICSSHKGGDMSARISLNFPLSLFLNGTQWKALLIRGICWIIYCKHDNVIIVHAGPQGPAHFLLCMCRTAQIMHSAELH